MTFTPLGHPAPVNNETYSSRSEAEQRMNELEKAYDDKLFISKRE